MGMRANDPLRDELDAGRIGHSRDQHFVLQFPLHHQRAFQRHTDAENGGVDGHVAAVEQDTLPALFSRYAGERKPVVPLGLRFDRMDQPLILQLFGQKLSSP